MDKQEEDDWAEQTNMITRMRGMLEDENNDKRYNKMNIEINNTYSLGAQGL